MRVRENYRIVSKAVVIAIREREILGLEIGSNGDEAFWTQFLRSLVARGLSRAELETRDAHEGLTAAPTKVRRGASWQYFQVHFMRNVLAHMPKGNRPMATAAIRTLIAEPSAQAAYHQLAEVAKGIQPRWPQAVEVMLGGED